MKLFNPGGCRLFSKIIPNPEYDNTQDGGAGLGWGTSIRSHSSEMKSWWLERSAAPERSQRSIKAVAACDSESVIP